MHAIDLIFLSLTAIIAYKLYSILGQNKPSDGDSFSNPNPQRPAKPMRSKEPASELAGAPPTITALKQIQHEDPLFTQEHFLKGAEKAFEIILKSFIKGDKNSLKKLVDPFLLKEFSNIIDKRKKEKSNAELSFFRIVKIKIDAIKIKGKNASIDVLFESEQTQILKDPSGEILEGDPNRIDQIEEIWTFEKPLKSRSSIWILCNTKSP